MLWTVVLLPHLIDLSLSFILLLISSVRFVQFLWRPLCSISISRVGRYVMVVRAEALECGSWRPGAVPARQLPGNRWSLPRCSPPPPPPPPPPASPAHHLPTFHIAHLHPSFLLRSCPTSFSITCPLFHQSSPLAQITGAASPCSLALQHLPNYLIAPSFDLL